MEKSSNKPASKVSSEMLDVINELVTRKTNENSALRLEIEELKKKLAAKELAANNAGMFKRKFEEAERKLDDANATRREMRAERDRFKAQLKQATEQLKESRGATNRLYEDLDNLKNHTATNYITKEDHERAIKQSREHIASLQAEIELFRNDINNVSNNITTNDVTTVD